MCVRSLATNLPVKLANSMSELPRRRSTAKALASPVMDASHAYNQSLSFNGLSQLDESKSLSEAMLIDHAALAEKKAVSAERESDVLKLQLRSLKDQLDVVTKERNSALELCEQFGVQLMKSRLSYEQRLHSAEQEIVEMRSAVRRANKQVSAANKARKAESMRIQEHSRTVRAQDDDRAERIIQALSQERAALEIEKEELQADRDQAFAMSQECQRLRRLNTRLQRCLRNVYHPAPRSPSRRMVHSASLQDLISQHQLPPPLQHPALRKGDTLSTSSTSSRSVSPVSSAHGHLLPIPTLPKGLTTPIAPVSPRQSNRNAETVSLHSSHSARSIHSAVHAAGGTSPRIPGSPVTERKTSATFTFDQHLSPPKPSRAIPQLPIPSPMSQPIQPAQPAHAPLQVQISPPATQLHTPQRQSTPPRQSSPPIARSRPVSPRSFSPPRLSVIVTPPLQGLAKSSSQRSIMSPQEASPPTQTALTAPKPFRSPSPLQLPPSPMLTSATPIPIPVSSTRSRSPSPPTSSVSPLPASASYYHSSPFLSQLMRTSITSPRLSLLSSGLKSPSLTTPVAALSRSRRADSLSPMPSPPRVHSPLPHALPPLPTVPALFPRASLVAQSFSPISVLNSPTNLRSSPPAFDSSRPVLTPLPMWR